MVGNLECISKCRQQLLFNVVEDAGHPAFLPWTADGILQIHEGHTQYSMHAGLQLASPLLGP
jgi:hypothetical protein